jgi:hypothetical protein
MSKKDDTTIEISTGGTTATVSSGQLQQFTEHLKELVKQGTLTAFGLLNREYTCRVMKVSVPRHEDKTNGFIDQSADMLFALQVTPADLEYNGLLAAAYEFDANAGCYRAAPGESVNMANVDKDYVLEIANYSGDDDENETKWELLSPVKMLLSRIIPDADKETAKPQAEVMILARHLPFHLAGQLWYPNLYKLRFKERQMNLPFGQDGEQSADASANTASGEDEAAARASTTGDDGEGEE